MHGLLDAVITDIHPGRGRDGVLVTRVRLALTSPPRTQLVESDAIAELVLLCEDEDVRGPFTLTLRPSQFAAWWGFGDGDFERLVSVRGKPLATVSTDSDGAVRVVVTVTIASEYAPAEIAWMCSVYGQHIPVSVKASQGELKLGAIESVRDVGDLTLAQARAFVATGATLS